MCPSLIEIGSKTAEKNSAQTNKQTDRQTDRHYENNGHLALNRYKTDSNQDTDQRPFTHMNMSMYSLQFFPSCICLRAQKKYRMHITSP